MRIVYRLKQVQQNDNTTIRQQLQLLETTIITIISPAGCNTDEHRVYQSHHAGRRRCGCSKLVVEKSCTQLLYCSLVP